MSGHPVVYCEWRDRIVSLVPWRHPQTLWKVLSVLFVARTKKRILETTRRNK